ncbi:hypothetical protein [Candidatus Methanosphaera massiliense]|uniref:hypothetical protein n=1 Tax=Methanosphaera TaxID=2316 RepID=UPI0023807713|nr:hypothetical protein [Candidatus Methanosphaera massiliense]MDD6285821.1 hypothetical protein [Methanobacteriaceae archaeon]MDE4078134.1 hypothetical protein [Candidatus Methanosphaera massiliense]MDY2745414.1 hypothetical protein [Methanosphaera sp.]
MTNRYDLLDIIRDENNIIRAELMSDKMKSDVMNLEIKTLQNNIPMINKGLDTALKEEEAILLIKEVDYSSYEKFFESNKVLINTPDKGKFLLLKEVSSEVICKNLRDTCVSSLSVALFSSYVREFVLNCYRIKQDSFYIPIIVGFTTG